MKVDVARYKALRVDGWTPEGAVSQARRVIPEVDGVDTDEIHLTVDGWDVRISAEQDEDHEFELGHFDNVAGGLDLGGPQRNPGFRYFHPTTTWEGHRASLRKMGFARHEADCLARRYVREDMQTQLGLIYTPWIISVVVSSAEVDFGFDAIGGVVLGQDGITVQEVVEYVFTTEMVGAAIEMAHQALDEVIVRRGHLHLVPSKN